MDRRWPPRTIRKRRYHRLRSNSVNTQHIARFPGERTRNAFKYRFGEWLMLKSGLFAIFKQYVHTVFIVPKKYINIIETRVWISSRRNGAGDGSQVINNWTCTTAAECAVRGIKYLNTGTVKRDLLSTHWSTYPYCITARVWFSPVTRADKITRTVFIGFSRYSLKHPRNLYCSTFWHRT